MSRPNLHQISGEQSPSPALPKPNNTNNNLSTKILSKILVGLIMIPVVLTTFLFVLTSLGFFSFFGLYLLLQRNYRHRLRRHRRHGYSDGLSPRCVKKLPQFKFREPTEIGGSDCVVCIDAFRRGQWCRRLPRCGHVFHRKCVDLWLMKVATCPICRDSVRLEEDEIF